MASFFTVRKSGSGGESHSEQLLEGRGAHFHPYFQLSILGLFCFMCPVMLNVYGNVAQILRITLQTLANGSMAKIITNSIVSFFAGAIVNALGPRLSLFIGGLGYSLYIVSFWVVSEHPNAYNFIVAAEAILGICAGMLWTAQGSVMLAYPTENRKGLIISIFWVVFNLGPLVGSAITFAGALNGKIPIANNGTYAGFFILTIVGALLALFMVNPARVIRTNGTKVAIPRQSLWKKSLYSLYAAPKTDPMIFFLFPMFIASNYFEEWQQVNYDELLFNVRTGTLNNILFAVAQMLGSVFLGYGILDRSKFSRRTRAFAGWIILVVLVFVVHIWTYFFQRSPPESSVSEIDFTDSSYIAHAWLFIFYGFMDAIWNTLIYWLLGAISNDLTKLAVFVGFYQGLQVAGFAAAARAETNYFPSFLKVLISSWVLCVVAVLIAFPMIYYRINDNRDQDDHELSVFIS